MTMPYEKEQARLDRIGIALERIADALESIVGETVDGTGFVRVVTGDKQDDR